jgi:acid phosphatase
MQFRLSFLLVTISLTAITVGCKHGHKSTSKETIPVAITNHPIDTGKASSATTNLPQPAHVLLVILENHAYEQIIGNEKASFINSLAKGANSTLFTQSYSITHPSQPNYLCLFSGSTQGVNNDDFPSDIPFTTPNLGRQLLDAGKTFISYSEDIPGTGFDGSKSGKYVHKHNPSANWTGNGDNQLPADVNEPFTSFPTDYTKLPTVCYVIPGVNNDMHNGSVAAADNWLKTRMGDYITWAKTHNSLFILTFDEDDYKNGNHIVTIFSGEKVKKGNVTTKINHFDVLRTVEDMYGLGYAGEAAKASSISNCWK